MMCHSPVESGDHVQISNRNRKGIRNIENKIRLRCRSVWFRLGLCLIKSHYLSYVGWLRYYLQPLSLLLLSVLLFAGVFDLLCLERRQNRTDRCDGRLRVDRR